MSIFCLSLVLISCKGTKKFQEASNIDSIDAYEKFITDKPKSPFVQNANERLEELYEEKMWSSVKSSLSIHDFEAYIKKYPKGNHASAATTKIEQLRLERDWSNAETINTEKSYSEFIENHPMSGQAKIAKIKVEEIKQDNDWRDVKRKHTVKDYEAFKRIYPNSKYQDQIDETLFEIKVVAPAWNKAEKSNTIKAYEEFKSKFPNSNKSTTAQTRINSIKESEWQSAKGSKNISKVKNYINTHPNSVHNDEAEKLIIDLEVDEVFKSDHGKMPPLEKIQNSFNLQRNEVTINNNTDYVLTVRYSGKDSQKMIIQPGRSSTLTLPNGDYRIAASVNSSSVQSFAGNEVLENAHYETTYYIVTERY